MKRSRLILDSCVIGAGLLLLFVTLHRPATPARRITPALRHFFTSRAIATPGALVRPEPVKPVIAEAYAVARTDPEQALRLAMSVPATDPAGDALVVHSAAQWATTNSIAAVAWVEKLEDPALRERVAATVATVWSETDPIAAAQWALQNIPTGRAQDDAVIGIVQRWTKQAPTSAADWVAQFPEGPLRETAVEDLMNIWAEQQPDQAAQWLAALPAGHSRDTGVAAYTTAIASANPALAAQWAEFIDDAPLRQRQLAFLAESRL